MKIFYTKIYHTKVSLHENFQIYGIIHVQYIIPLPIISYMYEIFVE